jgi:hypothetical protein
MPHGAQRRQYLIEKHLDMLEMMLQRDQMMMDH